MSKETEIRTAIAIRLINFRNLNNLTQKKMATLVGAKRSTYGKYEERKATPPLSLLRRISCLLKISLDELTSCEQYSHS